MNIERGLLVKCISQKKGFTLDRLYEVIDSRVNYNGYLEVKITDDSGVEAYVTYTLFEEVSRQRDDIFKELGI